MVLSLFHSTKLEENICQPDPKTFPDANERIEIYLLNRNYLRSLIDFIFIYLILAMFLNLPFKAHIFWLGLFFFHLFLLICFCRARQWKWHLAYTLGITFSQPIFNYFIGDCFLYSITSAFINPFLVLQITSNISHIVINFCGQTLLLYFLYRQYLEQLLMNMSPMEFADKYVDASVLVFIAITLSYSLRYRAIQDIQRQLKASKIHAEHAYKQLTLFHQTFSHELRNPLNSLLGNLELALHEPLPLRVHDMIETAKVCSELLLQLINNILDSGKAQLGKLDVNPTPTRVVDFVAGVWRISRDLIKRKKLNGTLKIDRYLPPLLYIDFYRINQILMNLISNAIKFTDNGQLWIKFAWLPGAKISDACFEPHPYEEDGLFEKEQNIRAIYRSTSEADQLVYLNSSLDNLKDLYGKSTLREEKGILKIIVRDTGHGIKKDKLDMLFGKFSQVTDDKRTRELGSGLGLYITKEIVEAMNGEIRVYSKENVGTTFMACIPTYCPRPTEQTTSLNEITSRLKFLNIQALVVDDNMFNSDLIGNYLSKINGRILATGRNGVEGYFLFKDQRQKGKKVDIVIIDVDIPIMNGKSLCKKIREYEEGDKEGPVRVLFVSGNYEEFQVRELLDKCGEYRGDTFLKKPISFESFINVLGNLTF